MYDIKWHHLRRRCNRRQMAPYYQISRPSLLSSIDIETEIGICDFVANVRHHIIFWQLTVILKAAAHNRSTNGICSVEFYAKTAPLLCFRITHVPNQFRRSYQVHTDREVSWFKQAAAIQRWRSTSQWQQAKCPDFSCLIIHTYCDFSSPFERTRTRVSRPVAVAGPLCRPCGHRKI